MTKEAICKTLEEITAQHGFTCEHSSFSWLPLVRQTSEDYANVIFSDHWDFDLETMTCTIKITAQARVCRMGGNDTYDDLMRAAEQIKKAAYLAQTVNDMGLSYTKSLKA